MMSNEDQLKFYRQELGLLILAYNHYKKPALYLWLKELFGDKSTEMGFCHFFPTKLKESTPTLIYRVWNTYMNNGVKYYDHSDYYFRPGRIGPRRNMLLEAIELGEKEITKLLALTEK